MEKPDLMQVSPSLEGMVTCMPLVERGRGGKKGAVKELEDFACCDEILRYQLGGDIISKYWQSKTNMGET